MQILSHRDEKFRSYLVAQIPGTITTIPQFPVAFHLTKTNPQKYLKIFTKKSHHHKNYLKSTKTVERQ